MWVCSVVWGGVLGVDEVAHGLAEVVVGDVFAVHEELREDDLVHGSFEAGAAAGVEGLGVAEEGEGGEEELASDGEAVGGVGELGGDLFSFGLDGIKLDPELVLGPADAVAEGFGEGDGDGARRCIIGLWAQL